MTKPFDFRELDAQNRALIRREFTIKSSVLIIGDLNYPPLNLLTKI
ncbi:MAG: hypothetical protein ACRC5C_00675 [Bacilli bacterium]